MPPVNETKPTEPAAEDHLMTAPQPASTGGISRAPIPALMIAQRVWCRQIGISDVTAWRWAKLGWIHPVLISNKRYLTADDLAEFYQRARAGELAQEPRGAAVRKGSNGSRVRGATVTTHCKKTGGLQGGNPPEETNDTKHLH